MVTLKVYGLRLEINKKTVCGCINCLPNHDTSKFNNYLEVNLKKLSSENNEVYVCGDFIIDKTNNYYR